MLPPAVTWVVNDHQAAPPAARIVEDWQMADPKNPRPPARKKADKKNPAGGLPEAFRSLMYDVVPFMSGAAIGYLDGRFADPTEQHRVGKHWAKLSAKKKIFALAVLAAALWWWEQKSQREGKAKMGAQMEAARHGVVTLIGRYIGAGAGAKAAKKAAEKRAAQSPTSSAEAPEQKTSEGAGGGMSWEDYERVNAMVDRQVRALMDELDRRERAGEPVAGLNVRQLPGMHDAEYGGDMVIDRDTILALSQFRMPAELAAA